MQFVLVIFGLILAARSLYPEEIIQKMNDIQPRGLEFMMVAVLLMILNRTVMQFRSNKKNLEDIKLLTASQDSLRAQLETEKQAGDKAKATSHAAEVEKDKFQGAFRASQPQIDRLKAELEELKKGQKDESSAATLLSLLQRKGRFLDFVMAEASSIPDEQFGAAARVVHQGCSEVIATHFDVVPVAEGEEGAAFELGDRYNADQFRLTGKVADEGPYSGVLIHKGWQTKSIALPKSHIPSDGLHVFAQAEVELT